MGQLPRVQLVDSRVMPNVVDPYSPLVYPEHQYDVRDYRFDDGAEWTEEERWKESTAFLSSLFTVYSSESQAKNWYMDLRALHPHWSEHSYRASHDEPGWSMLANRGYFPLNRKGLTDAAKFTEIMSATADVYMSVLPRNAKNGRLESLAASGWVWVDIDCKGLLTGQVAAEMATWHLNQAINKLGIPKPDWVVESLNGIHVYWRLKQPFWIGGDIETVRRIKEILSRLVYAIAGSYPGCKADSAPSNPGTVLRVAGSFNHKIPGSPYPIQGTRVIGTDHLSITEWDSILPDIPRRQPIRQYSDSEPRPFPLAAQRLLQEEAIGEGRRHEALKTILASMLWSRQFDHDTIKTVAIDFGRRHGMPEGEVYRLTNWYLARSYARN